jgi:hypothetical protein
LLFNHKHAGTILNIIKYLNVLLPSITIYTTRVCVASMAEEEEERKNRNLSSQTSFREKCKKNHKIKFA